MLSSELLLLMRLLLMWLRMLWLLLLLLRMPDGIQMYTIWHTSCIGLTNVRNTSCSCQAIVCFTHGSRRIIVWFANRSRLTRAWSHVLLLRWLRLWRCSLIVCGGACLLMSFRLMHGRCLDYMLLLLLLLELVRIRQIAPIGVRWKLRRRNIWHGRWKCDRASSERSISSIRE